MAEDNTEQQTQERTPEQTEELARKRGWKPKEQWKGPTDNWVDAETYVERSETILPHVQHDRARLERELAGTSTKMTALEQELAATKEALKGVTELAAEISNDRREQRKAEIAVALKTAREAGDDVKVAELQNELSELVKPAEKKPPAAAVRPTQPTVIPWIKEYAEENKEFFETPRKAGLFNAITMEKKLAGDTRNGPVDGRAMFEEVKEEVERILGANSSRHAPPKSEESRPTGGGGGNGSRANGKTYADLPPEAKAKCKKDEARFVGEKKAFKKVEDYQRFYAAEYFGPSAINVRAGE